MDLHAEADATFGPCLRPDCPGSVWAHPRNTPDPYTRAAATQGTLSDPAPCSTSKAASGSAGDRGGGSCGRIIKDLRVDRRRRRGGVACESLRRPQVAARSGRDGQTAAETAGEAPGGADGALLGVRQGVTPCRIVLFAQVVRRFSAGCPRIMSPLL